MLGQDILIGDTEIFNENFLLLCAMIPKFIIHLSHFFLFIETIIAN